MTVYGGSILLHFNLRRQTSKGPSQHSHKVPRETGEKPKSRMGEEGPDKIHRNIHCFLRERQKRIYKYNINF